MTPPPMLTEFFSDLVASSLRVSCLIVVLLLLRAISRGAVPSRFWFCGWLIVSLRLIFPLGVPVPWSPYSLALARASYVAPAAPRPIALPDAVPAPTATAPDSPVKFEYPVAGAPAPSTGEPNWASRLALAWLVGALAMAAMRVMAWGDFRRAVKRAGPASRRVADTVQTEAEALGLRWKIRSRETAAVVSPALFGLWHPYILFPVGFSTHLTDEELRLVVRHELAHWRRGDLIAQELLQLAVALHWFNPLVWLAARVARADCELACDASVLQRENAAGKAAYGATLLRVAQLVGQARPPRATIGIFEGKPQIAHRVRRVAGFRAASTAGVWGGVLLVTVLGIASLTRESYAAAGKTPGVSTSAENSASAVTDLVKAQQARIEQLENSLQELRKKSGLSPDQRRDLAAASLKAANTELQAANSARQTAEVRVGQIQDYRARHADLTELSFIANQPLVAALKQKWTTQSIAFSQLGERYAEAHPRLIEAKRELAATETELNRAVDSACRQIEAELESATRLVAQRSLDLDRAGVEVAKTDLSAEEIYRIQRQIQVQQAILDKLLERSATAATEPAKVTAATATAPAATEETFQVSVLGAVNTQSAVTLVARDQPIVLDAIARAGGFSSAADRGGVRLMRARSNGFRESTTLKEEDLMQGGVSLQRGDVIVVPEKKAPEIAFVTVMGTVNGAGRFAIPPGDRLSIVDAIALAGGPARMADLKRVKLTRMKANSGSTTSEINVDALIKGTGGSDMVYLDPNDIVMVTERIM